MEDSGCGFTGQHRKIVLVGAVVIEKMVLLTSRVDSVSLALGENSGIGTDRFSLRVSARFCRIFPDFGGF